MKPRIGITPCSHVDDYVESVRAAGGEPIVLRNDDRPDEVLYRVDGILLTGGPDVDPALYRQPKHDSTEIDPARDAFEVPLSRAALSDNVPLFAICRGVQVLNVAAGGTLVQDIPTQSSTTIDHAIHRARDAHAHDVQLVEGTRLASILDGQTADACSVNSRHHQAVGEVAPSFVVSAVSPDGIVEAIERPDAAFCVGVQWHPENFWRTGEFLPLFRAFIAEAGRRGRRGEAHGRPGEATEIQLRGHGGHGGL
jgi:putative glutamine amidotransferase